MLRFYGLDSSPACGYPGGSQCIMVVVPNRRFIFVSDLRVLKLALTGCVRVSSAKFSLAEFHFGSAPVFETRVTVTVCVTILLCISCAVVLRRIGICNLIGWTNFLIFFLSFFRGSLLLWLIL